MEYILITITFIFGMMIGSFLNVCIYRIPAKLSIITPPSRCGICGRRLKIYDLIPVFSWLFLLGKCRYCKAKISIRYLLVELLTGGLFVLIYLSAGFRIYLLPAFILTSLLIVITFIDIDTQTIPNGLILFGLICALASVFAVIVPAVKVNYWENALDALYGSLAGFLPLLLVNTITKLILKRDGMGGGDMKLMAVAGLFLGLRLTVIALILAIYLGGIAGAVILIVKRHKNNKINPENAKNKSGTYMPFGPFLAIGCFISMLYGTYILNWYISFFI